jgi:hypothetical protein
MQSPGRLSVGAFYGLAYSCSTLYSKVVPSSRATYLVGLMHFLPTLTLLLALLSGAVPAAPGAPGRCGRAPHRDSARVYEQDFLRLPQQRRLRGVESLHARSEDDAHS